MGNGPFREGNSTHTTPTLALAPSSSSLQSPPNLFPTFTDFLPRCEQVQQQGNGYKSKGSKMGRGMQSCLDYKHTTMGLGLILDDDHGDVKARLPLDGTQGSTELGLARAPFLFNATTKHSTGDSFTFCPSHSVPSTDSRSRSRSDDQPTTTQATSRSLRSLSLGYNNFHPAPQLLSVAHHALPLTPPHTPRRSPSLSLHPPPHPFLPPTPPTYSNLPLHLPYPLTQADTNLIASLHNGRTPSLEQLAPPEHEGGGQQPIVNTGNQGPMIVQQGDWACGTCSFVVSFFRSRYFCFTSPSVELTSSLPPVPTLPLTRSHSTRK